MSFSWFSSLFLFSLNTTPLSEYPTVYTFTYWRATWMLPSLGNYCWTNLCEGLCIDLSFQVLWVICIAFSHPYFIWTPWKVKINFILGRWKLMLWDWFRGCSQLECVCSVVSDSLQPQGLAGHQAPLSMGFPRQEYWSGLPFPSPGTLPDPGTEPTSLKSSALASRQVLYP